MPTSNFPKSKIVSHALVVSFNEIPHDGLEIETTEKFTDLYRPEKDEVAKPELLEAFQSPIQVKAQIFTVGSKVDLRGGFETQASGTCDRCTSPVLSPISGSFTSFLMPKDQFSEYDKPGGKVIHGPTREVKPSRHHSSSKAEKLTNAEGEHEDLSFGSFDGHTLDLRPLVREYLILQLPMTTLCDESCEGLCLDCGENISRGACHCPNGPHKVATEDHMESLSPLALALEKKLQEDSKRE